MRAHQLLSGQLIDAGCDPLGQPAGVDEHDGRAMLPYELEQTWIDRRPDAVGRLAALILDVEAGHVLDRDLDTDLHRLQPAGVDERDLAVGPSEEPADLFKRALSRGQADALRLDLGDGAKTLEAERQMAAALGGCDRVYLVHDEPPDRGEDLARGAREHEEK